MVVNIRMFLCVEFEHAKFTMNCFNFFGWELFDGVLVIENTVDKERHFTIV